jgi:hypothetical protein
VTEPAELRGDQWRTSATVVGAIPRLLGTALWAGADLVIGSRYAPGGSIDSAWGIHRRYLSGFGSWYANRILGRASSCGVLVNSGVLILPGSDPTVTRSRSR